MSVTDVVGSAVGVAGGYWFVAIVRHNTEKRSAEKLTKMGIENYLPLQREIRVWRNGRKSKVDRVVIPSIIFVRCTEAKRREIVSLPFINRFMRDKTDSSSGESLGKPLAIIPDNEIKRLKFMLGQSDVPVFVTERPYKVGDKVRIIRGGLAGLEGNVVGVAAGKSEVVVALDYFGCAKLQIDTVGLEIIND